MLYTWGEIADALSAVLMGFCFIIYIGKTITRELSPRISTWVAWGFNDLIITGSSFYNEEMPAGQVMASALGCATVALLLVSQGRTRFERLDVGCLALSVGGIAWASFYSDASLAIWVSCGSILICCLPTFANALENPASEGWWAWMLYTCSCIPALAMLGQYNAPKVAQVLVYAAIGGIMMALLVPSQVRQLVRRASLR